MNNFNDQYIININTKFVFIYKVWFSTVTAFLKIAKLYLVQYPF